MRGMTASDLSAWGPSEPRGAVPSGTARAPWRDRAAHRLLPAPYGPAGSEEGGGGGGSPRQSSRPVRDPGGSKASVSL